MRTNADGLETDGSDVGEIFRRKLAEVQDMTDQLDEMDELGLQKFEDDLRAAHEAAQVYRKQLGLKRTVNKDFKKTGRKDPGRI